MFFFFFFFYFILVLDKKLKNTKVNNIGRGEISTCCVFTMTILKIKAINFLIHLVITILELLLNFLE
jgi:hypothetical protein